MTDLFRLDGKVAVVVGGGGGIGKSLALGLARYGADVALASRNLEKLEAVAKELAADPEVKRASPRRWKRSCPPWVRWTSW
jgi:NAD(P)-dependent dehydrogenase (short-subunit alcohol dehydrogenase family)